MPSMASLHTKTAVLALLPLLAWGVYRGIAQERAGLLQQPVDIGMEHAEPAAVSISRSVGGSEHIIDVSNDSKDVIHVSLPAPWERDEVRNVPLASLIVSAPNFGYRRWTLPPHAAVTFLAPEDWTELTVHNASPTLLHLRVMTVDLESNLTDEDSYLLKEKPLHLLFRARKWTEKK